MTFDTDILIALGSARRRQRLLDRLAAATGPFRTTAINWAEIAHGIARLSPSDAARLREQYDELLPDLAILDFDQPSAEIFGRLRA